MCRIATANQAKFGLPRGQSNAAMRQNEHVAKPNIKARKLQANPNIVQIAPGLTEICSVYVKAQSKSEHCSDSTTPNQNLFGLHESIDS